MNDTPAIRIVRNRHPNDRWRTFSNGRGNDCDIRLRASPNNTAGVDSNAFGSLEVFNRPGTVVDPVVPEFEPVAQGNPSAGCRDGLRNVPSRGNNRLPCLVVVSDNNS